MYCVKYAIPKSNSSHFMDFQIEKDDLFFGALPSIVRNLLLGLWYRIRIACEHNVYEIAHSMLRRSQKRTRLIRANYSLVCYPCASGARRRWRNNTRFSAGKFSSTSARTAGFGNAQAISPERTAGPARKKKVSLKRKTLPRTGTYAFGANSALERSKLKGPFAKYLNTSCENTRSSHVENVARNI